MVNLFYYLPAGVIIYTEEHVSSFVVCLGG